MRARGDTHFIDVQRGDKGLPHPSMEAHKVAKNSDRTQQGMTIEQLSLKSGVTTRNIRAYQSRGLLPPPTTRGRIGYYNEGHLARLQLISSMQERGFSLAAIAELLSAWEQGRGLREVIGFETEPAATWGNKQHLYTLDELRELFDSELPDQEFLDGAVSLGVLEKRDDRYAVDHPEALRMAVEALRAGIPPEVVLEEAAEAMKAARGVAERLANVYMTYIWEPFAQSGMPAERLDEVTADLRRLRWLAADMMDGALSDALGSVIEEVAGSMRERSQAAREIQRLNKEGKRQRQDNQPA